METYMEDRHFTKESNYLETPPLPRMGSEFMHSSDFQKDKKDLWNSLDSSSEVEPSLEQVTQMYLLMQNGEVYCSAKIGEKGCVRGKVDDIDWEKTTAPKLGVHNMEAKIGQIHFPPKIEPKMRGKIESNSAKSSDELASDIEATFSMEAKTPEVKQKEDEKSFFLNNNAQIGEYINLAPTPSQTQYPTQFENTPTCSYFHADCGESLDFNKLPTTKRSYRVHDVPIPQHGDRLGVERSGNFGGVYGQKNEEYERKKFEKNKPLSDSQISGSPQITKTHQKIQHLIGQKTPNMLSPERQDNLLQVNMGRFERKRDKPMGGRTEVEEIHIEISDVDRCGSANSVICSGREKYSGMNIEQIEGEWESYLWSENDEPGNLASEPADFFTGKKVGEKNEFDDLPNLLVSPLAPIIVPQVNNLSAILEQEYASLTSPHSSSPSSQFSSNNRSPRSSIQSRHAHSPYPNPTSFSPFPPLPSARGSASPLSANHPLASSPLSVFSPPSCKSENTHIFQNRPISPLEFYLTGKNKLSFTLRAQSQSLQSIQEPLDTVQPNNDGENSKKIEENSINNSNNREQHYSELQNCQRNIPQMSNDDNFSQVKNHNPQEIGTPPQTNLIEDKSTPPYIDEYPYIFETMTVSSEEDGQDAHPTHNFPPQNPKNPPQRDRQESPPRLVRRPKLAALRGDQSDPSAKKNEEARDLRAPIRTGKIRVEENASHYTNPGRTPEELNPASEMKTSKQFEESLKNHAKNNSVAQIFPAAQNSRAEKYCRKLNEQKNDDHQILAAPSDQTNHLQIRQAESRPICPAHLEDTRKMVKKVILENRAQIEQNIFAKFSQIEHLISPQQTQTKIRIHSTDVTGVENGQNFITQTWNSEDRHRMEYQEADAKKLNQSAHQSEGNGKGSASKNPKNEQEIHSEKIDSEKIESEEINSEQIDLDNNPDSERSELERMISQVINDIFEKIDSAKNFGDFFEYNSAPPKNQMEDEQDFDNFFGYECELFDQGMSSAEVSDEFSPKFDNYIENCLHQNINQHHKISQNVPPTDAQHIRTSQETETNSQNLQKKGGGMGFFFSHVASDGISNEFEECREITEGLRQGGSSVSEAQRGCSKKNALQFQIASTESSQTPLEDREIDECLHGYERTLIRTAKSENATGNGTQVKYSRIQNSKDARFSPVQGGQGEEMYLIVGSNNKLNHGDHNMVDNNPENRTNGRNLNHENTTHMGQHFGRETGEFGAATSEKMGQKAKTIPENTDKIRENTEQMGDKMRKKVGDKMSENRGYEQAEEVRMVERGKNREKHLIRQRAITKQVEAENILKYINIYVEITSLFKHTTFPQDALGHSVFNYPSAISLLQGTSQINRIIEEASSNQICPLLDEYE